MNLPDPAIIDHPITGNPEPQSRWHDLGLVAVLALYVGMAAIMGGV